MKKEDNKLDLKLAIELLEQEKNISKEAVLSAIEKALYNAFVNHFKSENCKVVIDPETCEYTVYALKEVVEKVYDEEMEISLEDAKLVKSDAVIGDEVPIAVDSKEFGRVATTNAKNQILQKLREEEKNAIYGEFTEKLNKVVTGVVQRYTGKSIHINLGNSDSVLPEKEQVPGERLKIGDHVKVYVTDVKEAKRGPRISVSRSHPDLVKGLFELEVSEIQDEIIEIKSVAREAGSRSKIAVYTKDPEVEAVGSCVGVNGSRVNAIVSELKGEKIDIVEWNENPVLFIENALSPSKIIAIAADPDEKEALVIVPDYQLSLAIGKEGQNVRLAAKLTGFKIDIKSETQAKESGDLPEDYINSENFDESSLENIDLDYLSQDIDKLVNNSDDEDIDLEDIDLSMLKDMDNIETDESDENTSDDVEE